jgi:tRNA-specific 2-thiouridylase
MFPLGNLTKTEVRQLARGLSLPSAERPESQDLCFLAGGDYREFLRRHDLAGFAPGPILDTNGHRLGEHEGLAAYTIGQRRGLRVPSSEGLYVIHKDQARNALVVGRREELGRSSFLARQVQWVSGETPVAPLQAEVQVRYRAARVACRAYPEGDDGCRVDLAWPLPDVTPGQSAVFYQGEVCLGGGVIEG